MTTSSRVAVASALFLLAGSINAFAPSSSILVPSQPSSSRSSLSPSRSSAPLFSSTEDDLGEKFGGYTVKQRLREEVESPFRKVRLGFFGASAASALIALYFSLLTAFKASTGGFADVPPLDEALTSVGINVAGVVVCSALVYRDWKAGEANLARIAKGGALARLVVSPAASSKERAALKDYRRSSRVILCAGGPSYISTLARSLNSDQLSDENRIPEALSDVDVLVVPILLNENDGVADTRRAWVEAVAEEGDRNFDITRSDDVVAFPQGNAAWADYLKDELETARGQGFDVLDKGFTITVKKNGRILRRATGQPQWGGLIGTMEVMDGSKFGMPGDDEKYGGN
mmetsp:Transcript_20552/g.41908  ORF Transcript_20552/g.41908 Transcript_20552/m.41908 type:complete len:345 (+) Transcript_20552:145-1179(+)